MGRQRDPRTPSWYPFWCARAWHYDFRVEGERFRRSTGVCDPAAIEIAIEVAKGVHDAAWQRALSPYPTFEAAAGLYLGTVGKNVKGVEALIDFFGPFVRIDEIGPFERETCVSSLKKPGWTDATTRRQIIVPLSAVLRNALGERPQERTDNARERILSPEEFERLLAVAQDPPATVRDPDRRLPRMIVFLIGSGATPGEMFCVRAKDLNPRTGEVWIRGKDKGAGKTAFRPRMVWLPERAWNLMGDLPSSGRVFLSSTGKEIVPDGKRGSTVIRQFHKLCRAAGLSDDGRHSEPLVLYSLRHSWATWFSSQVHDSDLLIDNGGWADARMARRYRKRPSADLADRLLSHGWDFGQVPGNRTNGERNSVV